MRAIISWGLYIFDPIFEDNFFVFNGIFQKILMMISIQERVMMASVRTKFFKTGLTYAYILT